MTRVIGFTVLLAHTAGTGATPGTGRALPTPMAPSMRPRPKASLAATPVAATEHSSEESQNTMDSNCHVDALQKTATVE